MALRSIEAILTPDNLHYVGDGFRVYGILGRREPLTMKRMSPFLLMDYAPVHYFPPNNGAPLGVGSHPHRGIETVTIAYKGKVEHNDSTGAGGVIEEGGIQWMTSGKGILHKEYHEKNIAFVSISIDESRRNGGSWEATETKWRNFIKDKQMSGIQLWAGKDQSFQQEYQITGIPRFILIDPQGNIVDANAKRPSDPELKTLFNSLKI